MPTRHFRIWGLISLAALVLTFLVPNLKCVGSQYVFFILRVCLIFSPSLAIRRIFAVVIALPVTILMAAVCVVQIGSHIDCNYCILAFDLVINATLIHVTYSEPVDGSFGPYLSSMFIPGSRKHWCSICLDKIDGWDDGVTLACNHYYHYGCIDDWFVAQLSSCVADNKDPQLNCPLCRFDPILLERKILEATETRIC